MVDVLLNHQYHSQYSLIRYIDRLWTVLEDLGKQFGVVIIPGPSIFFFFFGDMNNLVSSPAGLFPVASEICFVNNHLVFKMCYVTAPDETCKYKLFRIKY